MSTFYSDGYTYRTDDTQPIYGPGDTQPIPVPDLPPGPGWEVQSGLWVPPPPPEPPVPVEPVLAEPDEPEPERPPKPRSTLVTQWLWGILGVFVFPAMLAAHDFGAQALWIIIVSLVGGIWWPEYLYRQGWNRKTKTIFGTAMVLSLLWGAKLRAEERQQAEERRRRAEWDYWVQQQQPGGRTQWW